jgi:hypothetical protein
MVVSEMSTEACLRVLAGARLARLACARENQPYVVPVYLVYHEESGCLYGFTVPGQKVEWMRANPLVCVEVDEIATYDQWVSVIATGRYEELPETPEGEVSPLRATGRPQHVGETIPPWSADSRHGQYDDEASNDERKRAWQILKTHPLWEEPGCASWTARAHHDSAERVIFIYYRIQIDRITGHQATRDARDMIPDAVPARPTGTWDWLHRTLTRAFGGR